MPSSKRGGRRNSDDPEKKLAEKRQAIADLLKEQADLDAQQAMYKALQEFMLSVIEHHAQSQEEDHQQPQQNQQPQDGEPSGSASTTGTCTCECKCGKK